MGTDAAGSLHLWRGFQAVVVFKVVQPYVCIRTWSEAFLC